MVEKIEEKIDKKLKKGPAGLGLMILLFILTFMIGVGAGGAGVYYLGKKNQNQTQNQPPSSENESDQDQENASANDNESTEAETTYTVQTGDTLFTIGLKFNVPWTKIAEANGLTEQSVIKVGQILKIPGQKSSESKNFEIDKTALSEIQTKVDAGSLAWYLDPVSVAKEQVPSTYNISKDDPYTLKSKNYTEAIAIVEVVHNTKVYQIKLIQPIKQGVGGIWTTESVSAI